LEAVAIAAGLTLQSRLQCLTDISQNNLRHSFLLSLAHSPGSKSQSLPIQDEPEEKAGFQRKMSLERWHAED
jgi:hypothetical protein